VPSWLASLLGALLPEPERGAFTRRFGGRPAPASMTLGTVEFAAGVLLVYESAMPVLRGAADAMATEFLRQADARPVTPGESLGVTLGGSVAWLAWFLSPSTWALLSIPIVGLLRVVTYMSSQEALGEPSVWALLRLGQAVCRQTRRATERATFGAADAPDEILAGENGALIVHTARPREEWRDGVTIEVAERFYRVAARDQVDRPGGRRHRYRLAPTPEHEVIRRLIRYEPPAPEKRGTGT
jgi:hypothetical protein